jgi:hypothetical protein
MLAKYVKTGCALYIANWGKVDASGVGGEVKEEKVEEVEKEKKKKET